MGTDIERRLAALPEEQLHALLARARRLSSATTSTPSGERAAWSVVHVKCITEVALRAAEFDSSAADQLC